MDWKEAIAKLKKLDAEGVADLVSVVEARIDTLETDKFTTIGEKRTATQKATAYETALTAIAKAIGLDGDIDAILNGAEGKVRELASSAATAQTKLNEAETRATQAEGKVKTFERQGRISDIATKAGASAQALEKLLGDRLDEIKVEGEVVKLGDKTLREFVEGDDGMKVFLPALFPQQTTNPTRQPSKLPGGSPKGTDTKPSNPVGSTITKMKFAVPGSSNKQS